MSGKQPADGEDRRVRKTREALVDAFSELAQQRAYGKIRVQDISSHSDVGRSTFYEHYRDKEALLIESIRPLLRILASTGTPDWDAQCAEHLLGHLADQKPRSTEYFSGTTLRHAREEIRDEVARLILEGLAKDGSLRPSAGMPLELQASLFADVLMSWVARWLGPGCTADAAAFSLAMHRSLAGSYGALRDASGEATRP